MVLLFLFITSKQNDNIWFTHNACQNDYIVSQSHCQEEPCPKTGAFGQTPNYDKLIINSP